MEIASSKKEFNFFGFDTSVKNDGDVAFKAERDPEFNFDQGLFSGDGSSRRTTSIRPLPRSTGSRFASMATIPVHRSTTSAT
jgi:hypothetical protein